MDIFKIQIDFENDGVNDKFSLKLPFCNEERVFDTYWFYELSLDSQVKEIYPILINWIEKWESAMNMLNERHNGIFLSIGLWDECVEGFLVKLYKGQQVLIKYGNLLDNYHGYNIEAVTFNISEEEFSKEFETISTIDLFKKNIVENIRYLSKKNM